MQPSQLPADINLKLKNIQIDVTPMSASSDRERN